jgi:hypothetical protein
VSRTVRNFLPLVGEPTALTLAFEGDALRWLPGARRSGPDTFDLPLHAGAFTRTVRAAVGPPWQAGATRWRSLRWDPISEEGEPGAFDRLLPGLDAELGLNVESPTRVTLLLDARYQPPGGPVGAAADAMALRRVAEGTVQRFLEQTAARLGAEAVLLDDAAPADPPPPSRASRSAEYRPRASGGDADLDAGPPPVRSGPDRRAAAQRRGSLLQVVETVATHELGGQATTVVDDP